MQHDPIVGRVTPWRKRTTRRFAAKSVSGGAVSRPRGRWTAAAF
jgi:hypothetical protein